jgi:malonate transporter MadL subunit
VLGNLINIESDIGGVGFAMLLLMVSSMYLRKKGWMVEETKQGILFWSSIYIPIVVAMAATLNVNAAMSGGVVTLVAGIGVTLVCMLLVPLLSKIGRRSETVLSEKTKNGNR